MAQRTGKVRDVIEDPDTGERTVVILDAEDAETRYLVPAEAELQVEADDEVAEGDLLSAPLASEAILAPSGGTVYVQGGRVVIFDAEAEGKLIRLTEDLVPTKPDGERVVKGETLLSVVAVEEGGAAQIDQVEALDDELVAVTYHFEATLPLANTPLVRAGDKVRQGDLISKGVISPHVLLKEAGVRATRDYLLTEIHKVYKSQGVDINDKHIELVIRQMLNNVSIEDAGDSPFTPNQIVPIAEFRKVTQDLIEENQTIALEREALAGAVLAEKLLDVQGAELAAEGQQIDGQLLADWVERGVEEVVVQGEEAPRPVRITERRLPTGERVLLRISKAALESKSWLSAASFQRTTMVLDNAALRGAYDELGSLKANVIVSSLVPAGTGYAARLAEAEDAEADEEAPKEEAEAVAA